MNAELKPCQFDGGWCLEHDCKRKLIEIECCEKTLSIHAPPEPAEIEKAREDVIGAAKAIKRHFGPNHRCSMECGGLLALFAALSRLSSLQKRKGEG